MINYNKFIDIHVHLPENSERMLAHFGIGCEKMRKAGAVSIMIMNTLWGEPDRWNCSAGKLRQEWQRLLNWCADDAHFYHPMAYLPANSSMTRKALRETIDEFIYEGACALKLGLECMTDNSPNPEVYVLAEKAAEHDIPLLCHCFDRSRHDQQDASELTPAALVEIATQVPEARLIMAHCGLNYYKALPLVAEFHNIYVDISGTSCYADLAIEAVAKLGIDRVMYGSDFPARLPWSQLAKIENPVLNAVEREQILYVNANKLFKLRQ